MRVKCSNCNNQTNINKPEEVDGEILGVCGFCGRLFVENNEDTEITYKNLWRVEYSYPYEDGERGVAFIIAYDEKDVIEKLYQTKDCGHRHFIHKMEYLKGKIIL